MLGLPEQSALVTRAYHVAPVAPPALPNAEPLVSVLTPSLNQRRWLLDNLRSVAAQTYQNIEHIVIDGGSSDGTLDLLRREAGTHVVWRSQPDSGQSSALNAAFAMSGGAIIGWLNSDDAYFGATVVEAAVKAFQAEPRIAVVYGHTVLVSAEGLILQTLWAPPFNAALLRLHDYIVQPAAFVRRSFLAGRFVDESFNYAMDYELWLRLAQQCPMQRLGGIVAIDRHHPGRKSYVMREVGSVELQRLAQRYGVWTGRGATVVRKTWKILARLLGTTLIGAAINEPIIFDGTRDGRLSLLLRQLAVPRAWMNTGP